MKVHFIKKVTTKLPRLVETALATTQVLEGKSEQKCQLFSKEPDSNAIIKSGQRPFWLIEDSREVKKEGEKRQKRERLPSSRKGIGYIVTLPVTYYRLLSNFVYNQPYFYLYLYFYLILLLKREGLLRGRGDQC